MGGVEGLQFGLVIPPQLAGTPANEKMDIIAMQTPNNIRSQTMNVMSHALRVER